MYELTKNRLEDDEGFDGGLMYKNLLSLKAGTGNVGMGIGIG